MAQIPTTKTNQQYTLNWNDLARGLLLAVISAVLTALLSALQVGGFESINWQSILLIGATTAVSYLVKNFFTESEIVIQNPSENALEAAKEGAPVKVGEILASPKTTQS